MILAAVRSYENREIAEKLHIGRSSVERKLRVIRKAWQEESRPDQRLAQVWC